MNLQTICSESDFEIDFKLKKALILPDEYSKNYKLVYSEEVLQIGQKNTSQTILVITDKEVNLVHLSDDVEDIVEIEKFKGIGDIIFATSIQKNEGIYILIITDTYDLYIDRYDQIPEKTAPLIMVNLLEKSEINNHTVSSSRLEELCEGNTIKYDDHSKMLYIIIHKEKIFLGWFINDMLRNSRFYTYASDQDIFRPDSIPLQY